MDLVDEWSLKALLAECQNVDLEDKEGKDDYAFLEETIFPTLMPALVHLLEHAEEQGAIELPSGAAPASQTPAQPDPVKAKNFNAQRWLAEHLVRHHPNGGIFKHDSAFATHLREISERRREQRVERERLVEEDQRKAEEMRVQQELERTKREEEARVAAEEARRLAAEEKLAAREAASEAAVRAAAPQEHLELIMGFRAACLAQIAAFDFVEKDSTAELVDAMHRDAALLLTTHSRASYVAFGSLVDADTLLYHTAADKKEFLLEDEEDEKDAAQGDDADAPPKEKKVPRPPEITVRALPPRDAEQACVIKRGRGVTFEEVVDTGTAKYWSDVKHVEGMFFFEDKRAGTLILVPVKRDGTVVGVACADTLDSTTGAELSGAEVPLFEGMVVALTEAIGQAEWCLLSTRCRHHDARVAALAAHPGTLQAAAAAAVVDAVVAVCPDAVVAVAVADSDAELRFVLHRAADGTRTADRTVRKADQGDDVALAFAARDAGTVQPRAEPPGLACPVLDAASGGARASAVLYVGSAAPLHADVAELLATLAERVAPVLLAPAPAAMRAMRVLAAAGTGGEASGLYEAAAHLCARHANGSNVTIAMAHGPDHLRLVRTSGAGGPSPGAVVPRGDVPACKAAMRDLAPSTQGEHVAVPLLLHAQAPGRAQAAFGVLAMVVPPGDLPLDALAGVAAALAAALAVSQWRRKMTACGNSALASLLKRAPGLRGAFLAFPDVGGRPVCAAAAGKEVSTRVRVGELVEDTTELRMAEIRVGGEGPVLGYTGVAEADVAADPDAWAVVRGVTATLGICASELEAQGALFDRATPESAASEENLPTQFKAARFRRVTKETVAAVSLPYMDSVKAGESPAASVVAIMQGIMYILGHQQRDVTEWSKCRKLITHHIFKEMSMIDVRAALKEHKLKLAKECIAELTPARIREEAGDMPVALWEWVRMVLDVQGV